MFLISSTNINIKASFFKSSENILKKKVRPDCTVSNNKFSLVTLNELTMKTIEAFLLFRV